MRRVQKGSMLLLNLRGHRASVQLFTLCGHRRVQHFGVLAAPEAVARSSQLRPKVCRGIHVQERAPRQSVKAISCCCNEVSVLISFLASRAIGLQEGVCEMTESFSLIAVRATFSFDGAMIGPGRFEHDTISRRLRDPFDERFVALPVVGERRAGVGQSMSVEMVFRTSTPMVSLFIFSAPLLVIRGSPPGIRAGQRKRRGRSNSSSTGQTVSVYDPTLAARVRGQSPSLSGSFSSPRREGAGRRLLLFRSTRIRRFFEVCGAFGGRILGEDFAAGLADGFVTSPRPFGVGKAGKDRLDRNRRNASSSQTPS